MQKKNWTGTLLFQVHFALIFDHDMKSCCDIIISVIDHF